MRILVVAAVTLFAAVCARAEDRKVVIVTLVDIGTRADTETAFLDELPPGSYEVTDSFPETWQLILKVNDAVPNILDRSQYVKSWSNDTRLVPSDAPQPLAPSGEQLHPVVVKLIDTKPFSETQAAVLRELPAGSYIFRFVFEDSHEMVLWASDAALSALARLDLVARVQEDKLVAPAK